MKEEIIISGFGGQGALFAGTLLCQAAIMEGKFVTFFPSYGAEIRGGTANCQVIMSDAPIGTPAVNNPDILISLNESSYKKFASRVKEKGIIFANTSLYTPQKRDGIEILGIPANNLAEECGTRRFANMVMLGALISKKRILKLDTLIASIPKVLTEKRKDLWEANKRAVFAGYVYRDRGRSLHGPGDKKQAL